MSSRLWTWANNLGRSATLSSRGGTLESGFPLSNLVDGDPAVAVRCTTKQIEFIFAFAAPVHPSVCFLGHHNCDAGYQIHLKGYTSGALTTTAFDAAFTIGAIEGDGYRPDAYLDVDAINPSVTASYWGVVATYADNSQPLAFGEIFLGGTPVDLPRWMLLGDKSDESWSQIEHITDGGSSLRAEKGFRQERLYGPIRVSRAELEDLKAWVRASKAKLLPVVIVQNRTRPACYLALFDSLTLPKTSVDSDYFDVDLAFRQLSRGLVWP